MLHRVENLNKSTDKRIQFLVGLKIGRNRQRGLVGKAVPVSEILPDIGFERKDLFFLGNPGFGDFGVYRAEELEEVTEKQLQLETDLAAILSIFPNKNPQDVLDVRNANVADAVTVDLLVPVLRKRYKKEFANQVKVIKSFLDL